MELEHLIREIGSSPYQAGIFDLDNTLYAYKDCNEFAKKQVLHQMAEDLNLPMEHIEKSFSMARQQVNKTLYGTAAMHSRLLYLIKTLEFLNIEKAYDRSASYHQLFWKNYFSKMKIKDWVLPFFKSLQKQNIQIGILTDFTTEIQIQKLQHLGLLHFVDAMVSSEEAGCEKPNLGGLQLLLQKLKRSPQEVFYIGDDEVKDRLGEPLGICTIIC